MTADAAAKPVDDRKVKATTKGAKYGLIAGLMITFVYLDYHWALGYDIGREIIPVTLVSTGLCVLIGAAVGWLNVIPGEPG